jgi:hypothetical protein
MKNPKSMNCSVILTAVLLLSTYARDKTAPTGAQQAVLSSSAPPGLKVSIEPKVIERGSPCLFTVTSAEALSSLSGATMGQKVFLNPDQSRKTWYGLAGVALESRLGSQAITFKGSDASGRPVTFSAKFEVEARTANIRVPPEFTDPDDEEKARVAREALLKGRRYCQRGTNDRSKRQHRQGFGSTSAPPGQMGRNRYRPGGFDGAEASVKSGKEQMNENPQEPYGIDQESDKSNAG